MLCWSQKVLKVSPKNKLLGLQFLLTDIIISFLVVLARWLKTNTSPVCFGARYHHYDTFYVPRGLLAAIKRFTFTVSCLVTLEALTTGLSGSVDTMAGDIRKFSNTENVHQHRECATKFLQILSFFILLTFVYTFVEGKMFLAPWTTLILRSCLFGAMLSGRENMANLNKKGDLVVLLLISGILSYLMYNYFSSSRFDRLRFDTSCIYNT